jgi:hypothetical protein
MLLLTIIILIILIIYLLKNNISIKSLLNENFNENFLIAVKDRQKIGTTDNEDGSQPRSSWKAGGVNYETCYSTETKYGNSTGRKGTYFCRQGIDSGEVIPAQGLYALDFSNYNIYPGKSIRGKPLKGTHSNAQGKAYTLNNDGIVNSETLTLAQSKALCDALKDKCAGFVMVLPIEGDYKGKTIFISSIDEGWEDPDTYSKKAKLHEIQTNTISYVKKDVNYVEKAVPEDKINSIANKYSNLSTCNWKSANRCILRDYKYQPSDGTCRSDDGLSYNVNTLKDYSDQQLSEWLKTLYNRDIGVNKLASEAVNVNEYIQRCKDVDGYEFLGSIDAPNPYNPPRQSNVRGRFVRITINNKDVNDNWLQLAEVQVISNNRNVALNKSASSSGNWPGSANSKANDGNNDGNWANGSVYHSAPASGHHWPGDGNPAYWEVDLEDGSNTIDRIIISNRTDCCGFRLNNWLLSIYDNNKSLVWARIYAEAPNPKVTIDISQANNDMNNPRIKDYKTTQFNRYFYRVSDNGYKSKLGRQNDCDEECHKNICEGEKKKWLSDYQCRDYRSGEWEAEQAAKNQNLSISELLRQPWVHVPSSCCVIGITQLNTGSILGIGTDKQIWIRRNLYENWQGAIPNTCCIIGITQINDGSLLGIGTDKQIWRKTSLNANWQLIPNTCCIIGITQLNDGTILGIGTDYQLWTKSNVNANWQGPISNSCCVISITQLNDGTLLGIGTDKQFWTKRNLNENWEGPIPNSCCVIGIIQLKDGSLLGIGTDQQLYVKSNLCKKTITNNGEGKYMYGPWIANPVLITNESVTPTGEKVYIVFDHIYTKMVSQSGVGKYYQGPISDYKPCNWNSYNTAPQGVYLIR